MSDTGQRQALRIIVQLVGFGASLALLGWAVSIALSDENREQLERLGEASAWQVASLLGLSLASLLIAGAIFWVVLAPARRIPFVDVIATNFVAHFLAYLPFKLSMIARVAVHNRRNGVPLLTIGAWFVAFTLSMTVAIGSLLVAALVRENLDLAWVAIAGATMVVATLLLLAVGRFFGLEKGEARLHRLLDPLTPRRLRPMLRSARFRELHEGFAMLADVRGLGGSVLLRVIDLLAQAARFVVAAGVLGVDLTFSDAVLLALSYFVIGVVSPSGMLGVREMGTTAIASLAEMATSEAFAGVALLVTAADSIVALACAGLGLAWLRPDRLFRNRPPDGSSTIGG